MPSYMTSVPPDLLQASPFNDTARKPGFTGFVGSAFRYFRMSEGEREAEADRIRNYMLPSPPEDPALFSFVMRQPKVGTSQLKYLPFVP